ncbi:hypothetical protein ACFV0R_31595 [Streptomyces sp. NPDC059578]|uniref:hypothetical protein n=1 Tax=Streptomyces sp. NPDC059578 TaxID=3346874 RepID=UPI00367B1DB9
MVSTQILIGGDGAETVLDEGGLRIVDSRTRVEIPFAVIQEAWTDGGHHVEIVLSDSAMHRVDAGNPTAATTFVAALTAALPAQRDPAGSARITVTQLALPEDAEKPATDPKYPRRIVILIALAAAYLGYVIWVAVGQGAKVIAPIVASVPIAFGLGMMLVGGQRTLLHFVLKRRGISVPATLDFKTTDGAAWYKFTDVDGAERTARSKHVGPVARATYDPENPADQLAVEISGMRHLFWAGIWILGSLPLLVGGIAFALTPFTID